MPLKYMFNDADNMIDLARDIQMRVFWGGSFYLDDVLIPWKDLWDNIVHEKENNGAIGLEMKEDNIRFLY